MDLASGWTQYQRKLPRQEETKKLRCPSSSQDLTLNFSSNQFDHFVKTHPKGHIDLYHDKKVFGRALERLGDAQNRIEGSRDRRPPHKRQLPSPSDRSNVIKPVRTRIAGKEEVLSPGAKKIRSPSFVEIRGSDPWPTSGHIQHIPAKGGSTTQNDHLAMMKEPDTRSTTQEQLVSEVKDIYAGLVMVESNCADVDTANQDPKHVLTGHQWQAYIVLYCTLLHQPHDFFLNGQHPSASPAIRNLALKYATRAWIWRHEIHSFLELLRKKLPDSLEHMLTLIYFAFNTMEELYKTVPRFSETRMECLRDLTRYKLAIEDEEVRDRDVWAGCSRYWCSKAAYSEGKPYVEQHDHHLAILIRSSARVRLLLAYISLGLTHFPYVHESIQMLFDPFLYLDKDQQSQGLHTSICGSYFLKEGTRPPDIRESKHYLKLDGNIDRLSRSWIEVEHQMVPSSPWLLLCLKSAKTGIIQPDTTLFDLARAWDKLRDRVHSRRWGGVLVNDELHLSEIAKAESPFPDRNFSQEMVERWDRCNSARQRPDASLVTKSASRTLFWCCFFELAARIFKVVVYRLT